MNLSYKACLYFRDELRAARAAAYRDAEGFQEILFTIERLGATLRGSVGDLGKYEEEILTLAGMGSLADATAAHRNWHIPLKELYNAVRVARNDALHQGAFARHITQHAIELAIVLEDALMCAAKTKKAQEIEIPLEYVVSDFMVHNPVCAFAWQPVSFVRQQMLVNSFSYLPIWSLDGQAEWRLIADYDIAMYLGPDLDKRKERLGTRLTDAADQTRTPSYLKTEITNPVLPGDKVSDVLSRVSHRPLLVADPASSDRLVGILSAFDLL